MRQNLMRLFLILALSFLGFTGTANAGTVVADSGFKVDVNGFSFPNYGDGDGAVNLDSNQMQLLFGNAVCLSGKGSRCVLTHAARAWMEEQNTSMGGGHCYGFAVLANLIKKGQLPRFGYQSIEAFGGGPNAFDLNFNNAKLQRAIARAWAFQTVPKVQNSWVTGTPEKILQYLIRNLGGTGQESYAFNIFQPGFSQGHAITPYAVEDMGAGIFHVRVYDNNWPGDAGRYLVIDRNRNKWSYYAATKPGEPGALYEGDAKTKTLQVSLATPGLGVQACSFCVGRRGANSKHNQISLASAADRGAHLLITDQKGRRTGFIDGRLVNQIPGAKVLPRTSGGPEPAADGGIENIGDSLEPTYLIPKNLELRIKVDGSGLDRIDRESVTVVGPTFDATAEDLRVGPGRNAVLRLSPERQTLIVTESGVKSNPSVTFGAQGEKASYRIEVSTPGAPARSTFFFAKKVRYNLLQIGAKSKARQRYEVSILRYSAKGEATFSRSYAISGRQQAYLYYGPLASPKGVAKIAIGEPGQRRVKVLKVKRTE
ncbi:MAG TPA: hypothetical protein VMF31_05485 [Solirubrobacterales bacterium]|nr:hypothetical protein [Solirubrobacterales bacterium]